MNRRKQWIALDHFRRKLFLKYELKNVILKSLTKNQHLNNTYRYYAQYNKSKTIRYSTLVQQNNRCVISGRIWMVLNKTQYSRFVLRVESYNGNIPACRRASW